MLDKLHSLANSLSLLLLLTAGGALFMLPWLVALRRRSERMVWIFALTPSFPFIQLLIGWLLLSVLAFTATFTTTWPNSQWVAVAGWVLAVLATIALAIPFVACNIGWGLCLFWAVKSKTLTPGRSLEMHPPAMFALVALGGLALLARGYLLFHEILFVVYGRSSDVMVMYDQWADSVQIASVGSLKVQSVVGWILCLLWAVLLWIFNSGNAADTTNERHSSLRRNSHVYATVALIIVSLGIGALALDLWPVAFLLFLSSWFLVHGVPDFLKA